MPRSLLLALALATAAFAGPGTVRAALARQDDGTPVAGAPGADLVNDLDEAR